MPTLTITKSYSNGTVLTESQIDDIKNSVENFVNITKLGEDNLQNDSVGTSQLQNTAVTTAKLANNAVTDAKLASSGSTDADRAVSTNSIKDSAVTTAKIADQAVTQAKVPVRTSASSTAAVGQVALSGSSGNFGVTFVTAPYPTSAAITNMSVTITTLGNPVSIEFIPDGTSNISRFENVPSNPGNGGYAILQRGGVTIATFYIQTGKNTDSIIALPTSACNFKDFPSAGTYTYTLRASTDGSGTTGFRYAKMLAYELK